MSSNEQGFCHFFRRGRCDIIVDKKCNGNKGNCSFFKTEEQYISDLEYSIKLNRIKGNCAKCKYLSVPCRCRDEGDIKT